jgi:hypothetical protein
MINCFQFCFNFAFNLNLRCYTEVVPEEQAAAAEMASFRSKHGIPLAPRPASSSGRPKTPSGFGFHGGGGAMEAAGSGQGLTLVHFSAKPQPFLAQNTPEKPPHPP